MYTTYHLQEDELNEDFLQSVKQLFKNKKIAITVEEEMDETEYLMSSSANKEKLHQALEDYRQGRNLVSFANTEAFKTAIENE